MSSAAANPSPLPRPAAWALTLAFALVYVSWGTTYLAIKEGVRQLPPGLFGGVRILLAGLGLLVYLAVRGESLRLSRRDLFWTAIVGIILFVAGNGLISVALKHIDPNEASIVASILVATTPLWIGLLEVFWPRGERLTAWGWLGLLIGLAGVLLLLGPKLQEPAALVQNAGPLLVLGSAFSWSLGSLILRHRRRSGSHLASAAYQMVLGGGSLTLVGLLLGEAAELSVERFTPAAIYAFFHLLVIGSLVGFLSYTWLLKHVSAALAGTYAYVNPLVAILVGCLLGGETLTPWVLAGMAVILAGVALVRTGAIRPSRAILTREVLGSEKMTTNGLPVTLPVKSDT